MKTPFRWLVKGFVLSSVLIGCPVGAQEMMPQARGWHAHPIMRSTQQLLTSCLAPNQPLVVASTPHGVFAWNYETNQGEWGIADLNLQPGEEVRHVRYSPDGKLLLAGAETFEHPGRLLLYAMPERQQLKIAHTEAVATASAFSPGNDRVAVALTDKSVRIYQLPDLSEVKKLTGMDVPVTALSWSQDGKKLHAAGGGYTTGNLDKKNWKPLPPEGGYPELTEQAYGKVIRWDVESGKEDQKFTLPHSGPNMIYNNQGTMLASMGGAVRVQDRKGFLKEYWDGNRVSVFEVSSTQQGQPQPAATYTNAKSLLFNGPNSIMAWSHDGTMLVFSNTLGRSYYLWDGTKTSYIYNGENWNFNTNRFFFSPKGDKIITVSDMGIRVWYYEDDGLG